MTDLAQQIRDRLKAFDDSNGRTGSTWGWGEMQDALLAVVGLAVAHQQYGPIRVPQGTEGRVTLEKHAAAAEALAVAVAEIADKLGIEATDG